MFSDRVQEYDDKGKKAEQASAGTDSVLSKMDELAKRGHVPAMIKEMLNDFEPCK